MNQTPIGNVGAPHAFTPEVPHTDEAAEDRRAFHYARLAVNPRATIFTTRPSGSGVTTRIHLAAYAGSLLVWAPRGDGLAERLTAHPELQIAPCDEKGNLNSEPINATARFLEPTEIPTLEVALKNAHGWRLGLEWEASRLGRALFFRGQPVLGLEILLS